MSRIYVLDPESKFYLEIPYSTLQRPTITLWEHRSAIKKLRTLGIEHVDEEQIFNAIGKLRDITKEAAKTTKRARRDLARVQNARNSIDKVPVIQDETAIEDETEIDMDEEVEPFKDIETW